MKNAIKIASFLIILLLASSLVSAQYGGISTIGKGINKTISIDVDKVKQRVLKGVDVVLQQLDKIIDKVQKSVMPQNLKDDNIATIETIKTGVNDYKAKIEQATTISGIATATKELRKYLIDNKATIRAVLVQDKIYAAGKLKGQADALKTKVDQILKVLKVTCPSEKSDIDLLEQKLLELETKNKELGDLIKANANLTQIKAKAQEVKVLSMEITTLVKKIKTACGL